MSNFTIAESSCASTIIIDSIHIAEPSNGTECINKLNSIDHSKYPLSNNKIFSEQVDRLYEGTYQKDESIDFEECIDKAGEEEAFKTAQHIQEFEQVLTNFKPYQESYVKRVSYLNDIVEFLDISRHSDSVDTQHTTDTEQNICAINNASDDKSKNTIRNSLVNITNNTDVITTTKFKDSALQIVSESFNNKIPDIDDDDDGYNSSDFEFITENEASMHTNIDNFRNDSKISKTKINTCNINTYKVNSENSYKSLNSDGYSSQSSQSIKENEDSVERDPEEGPSGLNRNNHVIPEGDAYLDLFRGNAEVLPVSQILFLENKSIRPSPMNARYAGIGFDGQLIGRRYELDISGQEYEKEANESVKKIKFLYPGENRRFKRRKF